mmetsp:Transcript_42574/g.49290  ORF Transcript_42574/g.49290 Transcript_42574/m.49290 type:complete len:243 (-) Transcript_42574:266-994(-)
MSTATNSTVTKKVLILDLDETLVHCHTEPFADVSIPSKIRIHNQELSLYVKKRPGLDSFLVEMSKVYTLVLFTTGVKEYAHAILKLTGISSYFSAVLHRSYCQMNSEKKYEKNLSIFEAGMKDLVLVDNSANQGKHQPDNIFVIKAYKGDDSDSELSRISEFLEELAKKYDVRPVMRNFTSFSQRSDDSWAYSDQLSQKSSARNSFDNLSDFDDEDISERDSEGLDRCYVPLTKVRGSSITA